MIFELKPKKNKFLEDIYKKSMKELIEFYKVNWIHSVPKIFVVNSRKEINQLRGKNEGDWVVGWTNGQNIIFVLNYLKMKTESSHKKGYTKERYGALIKHELSHLFSNILAKDGYRPAWLWEGLASHTSGQDKFKIPPKKFSQFLSFYEKYQVGKNNVYYESGFFIGMLVEKFGKQKFLNFLKSLPKIKNKKEFDILFFKTYKFKLNYREINKIYTQSV